MLEGELNHIKEAKKGNQAAFGLLYDHYIPKIYRFVFLKTGNKAEAEDLTHEVFLSAWQNIYKYKHQGFPFSSWLYQIAKNAVIDHYRTAKKNLTIEGIDENLVKMAATHPDKLDFDLELEKLKKIISLLKPEYQDVLIMRFIEDLPQEEIAAAMDKSEGAVRLIQHRALKELKNIYHNSKETNGTITHEA